MQFRIAIMLGTYGKREFSYMHLSGSVLPWLLGLLLLLFLASTTMTLKAWRDAKRSPFYFLRRQAQKQMQTFATVSMSLMVMNLAAFTYAFQLQPPTAPRSALLANAKPVNQLTVDTAPADSAAADEPVAVATVNTANADLAETIPGGSSRLDSLEQEAASSESAALPAEYDQYEARIALKSATSLGGISFSTSIDDDFLAVDPQRIFEEGFFTVYATFAYEGMADGMEWAWVWRFNGEVIGGGNELWAYGADGPGFIFLQPEEGFRPGEYSLQVWVNEELMTESAVFVTTRIATGQ